MSKLTHNLLRGIDYDAVAKKREANFKFLRDAFSDVNKLKLTVPYGAFMYPLLINNGMRIRKQLQQMKIYIPTLWPNVLDECESDNIGISICRRYFAIPVDQKIWC